MAAWLVSLSCGCVCPLWMRPGVRVSAGIGVSGGMAVPAARWFPQHGGSRSTAVLRGTAVPAARRSSAVAVVAVLVLVLVKTVSVPAG
ncbi:hypothetical protein GCM10027203_46980 [Nonomuraea fastidiosa]